MPVEAEDRGAYGSLRTEKDADTKGRLLTVEQDFGRVSISGINHFNNTSVATVHVPVGWKVSEFQVSEIMSSYLVAWGIYPTAKVSFIQGWTTPFQRHDPSVRVPVRVFARSNALKDATFALDVAIKSIEAFERSFNVSYPVSKLDLFPMPDFGGKN